MRQPYIESATALSDSADTITVDSTWVRVLVWTGLKIEQCIVYAVHACCLLAHNHTDGRTIKSQRRIVTKIISCECINT